jgi:multidrug efflux pump subunit AcrA (membrane-fusion protein)
MIVPTADRSKATVMVKVRFNSIDKRILPEMSAKVAFLSREIMKEEQKPRTTVNPRAIIDNRGKKYLFIVKENRVSLTPVTLGSSLGDAVEILNGASSGDKVVVNPPKSLKNNDRIKIAER